MNTKISVVVPCYNQAEYLAEAVKSLLGQSYSAWECLIVNDGSTDDTETEARRWCQTDGRLRYVAKENGGLSSARNAGIAQSKGEFILPLDADDRLHKDYLRDAVEAFAGNPALTLVYADAEYFGARSGEWLLPPYEYRTLLLSNLIYCSAVFRKADWESAGGYDENLKTGWEDWEFWIRLLYGEKEVYRIPKVRFYYRQKEQPSMIGSLMKSEEKFCEAMFYIFAKHRNIYSEYLMQLSKYIEKYSVLRTEHLRIKNSKAYKLSTKLVGMTKPLKRFLG